MATIIQIKKPTSDTSVAPTASQLEASELAMVFGTATPSQSNGGGRLYIGSHGGTAALLTTGLTVTAVEDGVEMPEQYAGVPDDYANG